SECDVHRRTGGELGGARCHAPPDRVERSAGVSGKTQLEMAAGIARAAGRSLPNDPRWNVQVHTARDEHRRRVAGAERFEVPEQRFEIDGRIGEIDLEVDAQIRYEVVRRQALAGDTVELVAERLDARGLDADAGGYAVSAVAQQQVAAFR